MKPRHGRHHWGRWVAAQATAAGFARKADLAARVGCTPDSLSRWFGMAKPPAAMRKGFDQRLCETLRVSPRMLFSGFLQTPPTAGAAEAAQAPFEESGATLRREIKAAADIVQGERLRLLHRTATLYLNAQLQENKYTGTNPVSAPTPV